MAGFIYTVYVLVIVQKVYEYRQSRSNERWLRDRGGRESRGRVHHWLFGLQILFYSAILAELQIGGLEHVNAFWLSIILTAFIGRFWCMHARGKFWNHKHIVVPRVLVIKTGPYKFMRYPDYLLTAVELVAIPLFCGAYVSFVLFLLLHGVLTIVRLPGEQSLRKA